MQIKGIKVEWTQTFEHHCIYIYIFFLLQKNIIENFFEREVSRLKFVEERRKIRAMETAKNKGNEKPKEKAQVWLTVISMFVVFF